MASAEQPLCCLFSLADIQSATGDFSDDHVIGKGGFGKVYKALIDGGSTTVAVKRLASNSNQGEREFAMEMETLTKVRHRNLVSLIGYCREEGEMLLVYEYMTNGTLSEHLKSLSWSQRLQICIGAGRGLDYLHTGCSIIHRDVKSTNILLDESFRAKVSDFGLAKHLGGDELQSYVSASLKGSFGYFDPSYFTTGRLTRASDTYAFGVVLLEVLSGRSALDKRMAYEGEGDGYLCMSIWAQEKIRKGKAYQIVAPSLRGEISDSCLKTFVGVARGCLHSEPKKRITMSRAVAQLELALEQQERRGTATSRFQFWPFRSGAIASGSGSTQKDEPEAEAILITAIEITRASVDTQPRGLLVDDKLPMDVSLPLEDITRYFSPDHLIAEGPGGERTFRGAIASGSGSTQKDEPEAEAILITGIEKKQTSVDTQSRGLLVDVKLPIDVPAFPLAELKDITHYFSLGYLIAEGSRGELIFHGVLKSGQDVAIKQFYKKFEELDEFFIRQVSTASMLKHENLVQLLGYSTDGQMRALVYEFTPRDGGSLHAILHDQPAGPALSWARRIKIAAAVARGLCYIHDNDLIHRDIRSSNVLLFDNEIVKITHPHPSVLCYCKPPFGIEDPYVTGSHYYPSPLIHEPECTSDTQTVKGDVHRFGVVLLELLTGTQLFVSTGKVQQELVSWAKVRLFQDKVVEIVDARLGGDYPLKPLEKMGAITKLCLHYDIRMRPDMSAVSEALQIAAQETHEYYLHKR